MIFFFSGVGNSKWMAEQIAASLNEQLVFIPDANISQQVYELKTGERLGFVFPTYGWGVPTFIESFIEHLDISNVEYLWMVTTCGDDTGMTYEIFCRDVEKRGWHCDAAWAVQMPESYICLPGFDVDSSRKEQRKYVQAKERVLAISEALKVRKTGVHDTIPGILKWAKSYIVRPFFNRFLISPKPFKANKRCIGCGKCANVCPFHNVTLDGNKRPRWGKVCVLCLRCYHSCPEHALHWGGMTKNKGQYLCHIDD